MPHQQYTIDELINGVEVEAEVCMCVCVQLYVVVDAWADCKDTMYNCSFMHARNIIIYAVVCKSVLGCDQIR